jgi:hypothetical protein
MEVTVPIRSGGPGPYAPPAAILEVIRGFRDRGLATPFTADVLVRAGVSESLVPRTLKSLEVLELIDAAGMPTTVMEGLRRATSEEFPQRLADALRAVYVEVFNFVDPAADTPERVADAFRAFDPIGQRGRMVTLFLGLCEAAGIIPDGTARKQATPTGGRSGATPRRKPLLPSKSAGPSGRHIVNLSKIKAFRDEPNGNIPPAIGGLLASLPRGGSGWPQAQRDRWVKTFEAVLDFAIPVRDIEPASQSGEDEMDALRAEE